MSERLLRWLLFALFAALLPLPYYMIEAGRIPAVQLAVFTAFTAPLVWTDPSLTTRTIALLFAVQTLLYGALLYIGARAIARRIAPGRRAALFVGVAVALAALALLDVYHAPLSHGPSATNWFGIW